ncbi:MAG TPA: family 43 glycosylhydrolase [Acidimicrobiales bacterium]|nr:family 43 glycosylhydrolase [Acidimicrobiales bacterium]
MAGTTPADAIGRPATATRFAAVAAVAAVVAGGVGLALPPGPARAAGPPQPSVTPAAAPAAAMDAPDPDVIDVGGTYYAFTTGTTWGNHIGVLRSSRPDGGYQTLTGRSYGSTALPQVPAWEQPDTQTSPGVFEAGGEWVMWYDAVDAADGHYCLSVATASTPQGPYQDASSGPALCQTDLGGSIDPEPFVQAGGQAWLVWKSNDGSSAQPAYLWSAPLNGGGTATTAAPTRLLTQDSADYPWETTIENPDLVAAPGGYVLFFAAGRYDSSSYSEGAADCDGPAGPCTQTDPSPILTSYGGAAGPAAGNALVDPSGQWWLSYAAWSPGCTSYACGGARQLYVAPLRFGASGPECSPALGSPAVALRPTADGGGYWAAGDDGQVASCGDATARGAAGGLGHPVVGMATTSDGGGYWLVASDGGVFSFGDAAFHGSTGAIHLAKPVVGIAATPDGGGYWLVASDGGVFSFGDAAFFGQA